MPYLRHEDMRRRVRGNDAATRLLLGAASKGDAACSVLTRLELLAGMRSGERSAVRRLLDHIDNVEVTQDVANRAGEWARMYRESHKGASAVDYLVAATAEIYGADLLTRNVRHFPMFPDLQPAV